MKRIIVLVGLQGAGKTSLIERIEGIDNLVTLRPSTSREKREIEVDEYHFEKKWNKDLFAWSIDRGAKKYGMRNSELSRIKDGQCGLTVFAPESISDLEEYKKTSPFEVITIGLDTIDSIATQHSRVDGDINRLLKSLDDLERQRTVVQGCDAVLSGDLSNIEKGFAAIYSLVQGRGGVLTKDTIGKLIKAGTLLKGAEAKNIESASYDLRISDTYWCQGKYKVLEGANSTIIIPPYSFVLAQSREEAHLPRFISGNFDLTVSMFFDGLILSNGPQVDPGYHGSLFCMLYNTSDKEVTLNKAQKFASIQFSTTTQVAEGYAGQYQGKKTFQDFLDRRAAHSPGGRILERLTELDVRTTGNITGVKRANWLIHAMMLALIVSVLGIWFGIAGNRLDEVKSATEKAESVNASLDKAINELQKREAIPKGCVIKLSETEKAVKVVTVECNAP